MTTTTDVEQDVTITHPHWCEQTSACVDEGAYPEHVSVQMSFLAAANDAKLCLSLRRPDEVDPADGSWRHGEPQVWLGIENLESVTPAGGRIFADAYLSRDDVRLLRTFLKRYDAMRRGRQFEEPTLATSGEAATP